MTSLLAVGGAPKETKPLYYHSNNDFSLTHVGFIELELALVLLGYPFAVWRAAIPLH